MNGNGVPRQPLWGDKAKPFMVTLVDNVATTATVAEITERLAKIGKTPKDFLIDSVLNCLGIATQNNWAIALFADKVREYAITRADDLAALYGGFDNAILELLKDDLGAVSASLK